MKIGILTQPLRSNYGGILQNWALQQVLLRLGHQPVTIRYGEYTRRQRLSIRLAWLAEKLKFWCKSNAAQLPGWDKPYIVNHTRFVDKHIKYVGSDLTCAERNWSKDRVDAYVIGSDQVWRPRYNWSPGAAEAMFGGFIPAKFQGPIVSYAASFGTDQWEFTPFQTHIFRKLIARFTAISVREASGVGLCRTELDAAATHVLDPTMLLRADDYRKLLSSDDYAKIPSGVIGVYLLDMSDDKKSIIEHEAHRLGKDVFIFGKTDFTVVKDSIEHWLAAFDRCDCIITDSFHGSVFSILFHRPFRMILNPGRGNERFMSLLSETGLDDVNVLDSIPGDIDWAKVDRRLGLRRAESLNFLTSALNANA